MMFLKLNEEQRAQLEALNVTSEKVKASPRQAQDGFWYLCADLLTDCGEGQTYAFYGEFLNTLEQVDEPEWKPDERF